jgi:hypothetical protein
MYDIELQETSEDFLQCWRSAGIHLINRVDGGIRSRLRVLPYLPFLEQLCFRLGNQLFFVSLEDADQNAQCPGSIRGLFAAATETKGRCMLPMKKKLLGGRGWRTGQVGGLQAREKPLRMAVF